MDLKRFQERFNVFKNVQVAPLLTMTSACLNAVRLSRSGKKVLMKMSALINAIMVLHMLTTPASASIPALVRGPKASPDSRSAGRAQLAR